MRVLAEDNEIDDRTDEEYINDQLRREPANCVKGISLSLQLQKRSLSYYTQCIMESLEANLFVQLLLFQASCL